MDERAAAALDQTLDLQAAALDQTLDRTYAYSSSEESINQSFSLPLPLRNSGNPPPLYIPYMNLETPL